MKDTEQLGQVIAEMWMLSNWKIRFKLLRRLRREEDLSKKQLAAMILIAFFTDLCGIFYGKEWVVKTVKNKDIDA